MKNFWKNKNILITGINGFVGSNLAKTLINYDANVLGLIRNLNHNSLLYYEKINKKCTIVKGELINKDLIKRIIHENNIEIIFHLAAQVEVGLALKNPFDTFETNIRGTYSLLDVINNNQNKIKSIIIASSDKAYGNYPESLLPYKEDYALLPKFPYDVSKASADLIAQSYCQKPFKLPIIITRFANIYGPGQLNFSALIPDLIRSALNYSKFEPRSDGTLKRDYLFIDEVIDLYLKISEKQYTHPLKYSGEIYNAGSRNFYNVQEIVNKIFLKLKNEKELKVILNKMKNKKTTGEIINQYMDYNKVNKSFGWKPKINIDKGLDVTIKWFKKYLKKNL